MATLQVHHITDRQTPLRKSKRQNLVHDRLALCLPVFPRKTDVITRENVKSWLPNKKLGYASPVLFGLEAAPPPSSL